MGKLSTGKYDTREELEKEVRRLYRKEKKTPSQIRKVTGIGETTVQRILGFKS